jgi:hypothetical protein
VSGLREVLRKVTAKHVQCVILAPNIEECAEEGGLDGLVQQIITAAKRCQVSHSTISPC